MYKHLQQLCDYKPNVIVLIVKIKNKRICLESNPKRQRGSASLIPWLKDDLPETHLLIYHKAIYDITQVTCLKANSIR